VEECRIETCKIQHWKINLHEEAWNRNKTKISCEILFSWKKLGWLEMSTEVNRTVGGNHPK